ncbi:hypothetical protein MAM1_0156d06802 [Mucor ambiguus]|uniref:Cysteine-rich transmembrane CYSTM domain-containing protein n=1 Tax=Mucor ambiguus TaxID=91626 RepID=A0A0C9MA25_9FUNG|nr:hypothetical protein MAM1_0156d06802 [Mucor ambiguus]
MSQPYYNQQPGGDPGQYYSAPPPGQQGYYQPAPPPQTIIVQQERPQENDHSCCWGWTFLHINYLCHDTVYFGWQQATALKENINKQVEENGAI